MKRLEARDLRDKLLRFAYLSRLYMKTLKFAVLPGDGIGPEVMEVALDILKNTGEKFGFELDYDHADIGGIAIDNHGLAFPDSTKGICEKSEAILFGSVGGLPFNTTS